MPNFPLFDTKKQRLNCSNEIKTAGNGVAFYIVLEENIFCSYSIIFSNLHV